MLLFAEAVRGGQITCQLQIGSHGELEVSMSVADDLKA